MEIIIPVPNDADSPKFRTTVGSCKWIPENSTVVWTIKSFPASISVFQIIIFRSTLYVLICLTSRSCHVFNVNILCCNFGNMNRQPREMFSKKISAGDVLPCVSTPYMLLCNLQGGKEFLMRAHFSLPTVESEDTEGKPPIQVKFEIPYFTVSGIQV